MRILYVQQHFATGKGEAGVRGYNLVKTLAARGHEVTVICGVNWRDSSLQAEPGRWVQEKQVEDFRVVQLGVYYSNHQSFLARIWSFLLFGLASCWETVRRPADVVFASSTPLTVSLPALAARLLRRRPFVLEVRDLWPDFPIEIGVIRNPFVKKLLYFWEYVAYKFAWRLVALAPGAKEAIQRKAGRRADEIILIPNGSDTANLRPLKGRPRKYIPCGDNELVFGYTGTHGPANGLDAILDAAAVLQKRNVTGLKFVLIGDGRDKARLQGRKETEGLENVLFLGLFNKQSYNEVLCELDVGMQILKNVEGFHWGSSPNKFFDYLAAGRPVLVNYPGWMAQLVTKHDCGVAVAPDGAEAFADGVEKLISQRARFAEIGANGRRLAETQFSQQKILQDLASFVEEINVPQAV
jgi:glycosyltransferase involved in cell wall biosynthesis